MDDLFVERLRKHNHPLEPVSCGLEPVLQKLTGIKAVIFDVYGTCFISGSGDIGVSSAHPKAESLSLSLAEQGVTLTGEQAEEAMTGFYELIQLDHQQTRLQGIEFPEIRILEIWEKWQTKMQHRVNPAQLAIDVECRLNPVWPMPGLESCLDRLRAVDLALGIVSNAQIFTPCLFPAFTGRNLENLGFPPEHCVWSWTDKEAKPSVRLYEKALAGFPGIAAEECLYVGNDMRNDVAPASSAGMKTALFAGDKRSLRLREGDPLVRGVAPDLVLTHLLQLPDCI